jgi:hypothetical protein
MNARKRLVPALGLAVLVLWVTVIGAIWATAGERSKSQEGSPATLASPDFAKRRNAPRFSAICRMAWSTEDSVICQMVIRLSEQEDGDASGELPGTGRDR